jgi:segregation and condensation protein B
MSSDSAQDNMPEQEIEEAVASEQSSSEQPASEQATETPAVDDALSAEFEPEAGAPIFAAAPLDEQKIQNILEAALMAAGQPLSIDRILTLFLDHNQPSREEVHGALARLAEACEGRGIELVEVGSGFRYQAKQENAEWVARLWEERPARYSRALLETLALIAYRQPITRGEIEDIRGVSVSTNIMKTLMERDWVKVVGHRDVPGKPAMYASTRQFLDYFSLKSLSDLPSLAEIRDIDSINAELDLVEPSTDKKTDDADADTQLDLAANDAADTNIEEAVDEAATDEVATDEVAIDVPADAEDKLSSMDAVEGIEGSDIDESMEQTVGQSSASDSAAENAAAEDDEASTADPA